VKKREGKSRATSKAALLLFCNCIHLYTVIVHVTASVSPEIMLVDEKVFTKTIVPAVGGPGFVKMADFMIPVSVAAAVNVLLSV